MRDVRLPARDHGDETAWSSWHAWLIVLQSAASLIVGCVGCVQLAKVAAMFDRWADLIDAQNQATHYQQTGRKPQPTPRPKGQPR